jgi:hypothetical protein
MNDQEPPECRKVDLRGKIVKAVAAFDAEASKELMRLPDKLPADVAAQMVKGYQANGGHIAGMQAAYRIFLDRMEP